MLEEVGSIVNVEVCQNVCVNRERRGRGRREKGLAKTGIKR